MGEPVAVLEKNTNKDGFVRFETNRSFTGMGHETFEKNKSILGDRPVDNLAKALFETGKPDQIHIYAQMLTIKLSAGQNSEGLKKTIEDFFLFYNKG